MKECIFACIKRYCHEYKKAINRILTCSVALSMSFLLSLQVQANTQEETYE